MRHPGPFLPRPGHICKHSASPSPDVVLCLLCLIWWTPWYRNRRLHQRPGVTPFRALGSFRPNDNSPKRKGRCQAGRPAELGRPNDPGNQPANCRESPLRKSLGNESPVHQSGPGTRPMNPTPQNVQTGAVLRGRSSVCRLFRRAAHLGRAVPVLPRFPLGWNVVDLEPSRSSAEAELSPESQSETLERNECPVSSLAALARYSDSDNQKSQSAGPGTDGRAPTDWAKRGKPIKAIIEPASLALGRFVS